MITDPRTILDLYKNRVYNKLSHCDLYVSIEKDGKSLLHKIVEDDALEVLSSLINAKAINSDILNKKTVEKKETLLDIAKKQGSKKINKMIENINERQEMNESEFLEKLASDYGNKINEFHEKQEKKVKGGKDTYSTETDTNVYEKIHNYRQKQMFQLQDMIEQSRMRQNEGTDMINKSIEKLMEIMNVPFEDAKVYKTFLYQEIKAKYPDAKTSIDKAKILLDYVTTVDLDEIKKKLSKVNIIELRKIIESVKEDKMKSNTESAVSKDIKLETKPKKEKKEPLNPKGLNGKTLTSVNVETKKEEKTKKEKKEPKKEKKVEKTKKTVKKGGALERHIVDSEINNDFSYISTSDIYE